MKEALPSRTRVPYEKWEQILSDLVGICIDILGCTKESYALKSWPPETERLHSKLFEMTKKPFLHDFILLVDKVFARQFGNAIDDFIQESKENTELQSAGTDAVHVVAKLFAMEALFVFITAKDKPLSQVYKTFKKSNQIRENFVKNLIFALFCKEIGKFKDITLDFPKYIGETPLIKQHVKHICRHSLLEQTQEAYVEETEKKSRIISRFSYKEAKHKGNQPGIIAIKKLRQKDSPQHKKYSYPWVLKFASSTSPVVNMLEIITEKMSADIYRFLLGENKAPKIRLVQSNEKNKVYLASRYIENFQTAYEYFSPTCQQEIEKRYREPQNQWNSSKYIELKQAIIQKMLQVDGAFEVIAVSMLLGNYDIHIDNCGLTEKEGKEEAAIVDLARGLSFRAGYQYFTQRNNNSVLSHANTLKKGESYRPEDIMRSLHGAHYKIYSYHFLKVEFAEALERIAEKMEKESDKLINMIKSSEIEVQQAYAYLQQEEKNQLAEKLKRIAPGTTLDNLASKVGEGLQPRIPMLKEFARNIRFQCAMENDDTKTLEELLKQHPEIKDKNIKWLTSTDEEEVSPPMTIKKFAKKYCSTDIQCCFEVKITSVMSWSKKHKSIKLVNIPNNCSELWVDKTGNSVRNGYVRLDKKPTIQPFIRSNHNNILQNARELHQGFDKIKEYVDKNLKFQGSYNVSTAEKILKIIYTNIPPTKNLALETNHPVYYSESGKIHRQENWMKCVSEIVKERLKNQYILYL